MTIPSLIADAILVAPTAYQTCRTKEAKDGLAKGLARIRIPRRGRFRDIKFGKLMVPGTSGRFLQSSREKG